MEPEKKKVRHLSVEFAKSNAMQRHYRFWISLAAFATLATSASRTHAGYITYEGTIQERFSFSSMVFTSTYSATISEAAPDVNGADDWSRFESGIRGASVVEFLDNHGAVDQIVFFRSGLPVITFLLPTTAFSLSEASSKPPLFSTLNPDGSTFAVTSGGATGVSPTGDRVETLPGTVLTATYQAAFNTGFESGLSGWTVAGQGLATAVNGVAILTTGSPVSIEQAVDTPAEPFIVAFDYLFEQAAGTVDVLLDGILLDTITAPADRIGEWSRYEIGVIDPTLFDLFMKKLTFRFDDPLSGQRLRLDNIDISPVVILPSAVPEPGSLALLTTGGLGLMGGWYRRRRRSNEMLEA